MTDQRPATLAITSDYLKPLAPFAQLKAPNGGYALAQTESADPYIATGAWCALLTTKLLPTALVDRLVAACRYGAVRTRAFEFASGASERALARRIAETEVEPIDAIRQRRMRAELAFDFGATATASGELYLATGGLHHLLAATREAETAGGCGCHRLGRARSGDCAARPRAFGRILRWRIAPARPICCRRWPTS